MKILTYKDKSLILSYIQSEPEYNAYIFGDIEKIGFNDKNLSFFCTTTNEKLDFILMKYFNDFVLYSKECNFDKKAVANFIQSFNVPSCISGKKDAIDKIFSYFDIKKRRNTKLAAIYNSSKLNISDNIIVSKLSSENVKDILNLYLEIESFRDKYINLEDKAIDDIKMNLKTGRTYGIYVGTKLVSVASTVAESKFSAMITNVGTNFDYRNKGFASIIISKLCLDLFNENKMFVALYYDNDKAWSIYSKLGFIEIGDYSIIR